MMMHAFKYSLCIEAIQRHRPNFPSESYFSEWPKKKNKFDQIRNTCTINLAPVVCSYIHRVSNKGYNQTHGGNFVKSQPIFKIISPLEREGNLQ